jgi:glycosyltransferase involved in cell wall biosynthesis
LYDNFGELQSKSEAKSKLGLIEGERYILFFGFIRDYKGLDLILEAMALKEIKDISVKLIVAGEFYSDKQPYLDLIEKLKIHKSVILKADFIPDDKVASYFSAADLVVQPYKHATQSGVTQICYHFEKPMLVTNVGGLPEIVPHQKVGYVVDTNALSIAQAINDFYVNNREREFVNNTKIEKIKYSWATMLSSIQTLCEKV